MLNNNPTPPEKQNQRVELARQLFREFHTRCFWHCPRDLVITDELVPLVVKGLRKHGGRRGFMLAGQLQPQDAGSIFPDRDTQVGRGEEQVRLDWTTDSVFRFFPVQRDEEFGYCLHQADIATNKALAFAGRSEIRDYLDILQIDQDYLSLAASMWAACGKDPGFTPELLLDQMNRHSRYQESDLLGEYLGGRSI